MRINPYLKKFLKVFSVTMGVGLIALAVVGACAVMGVFGTLEEINVNSLTSDTATRIYYVNDKGEQVVLKTISSEESRIWVDFEDIPKDMKDAIVAIEDERFYKHKGFDMRRTTKAVLMFAKSKLTGSDITFGGSTITQQLVKNITNRRDETAARKILEISSAVNLEKKISKDKILELYLNSIYLSQGCSGIQSASYKFFGKPVSELNLAECASIAGITQYPSRYDPLVNPENNKEKQEIVLAKMLELGFISQEEHDEAVNTELKFTEYDPEEITSGDINSYFEDYVIQTVLNDLKEQGYPESIANKMLYSGGLKIYTTLDPSIQRAMEDVFENPENFPNSTGEKHAQASMVVIDPKDGGIKGMVGGLGRKTGNLVLNRAYQTLRQPGSTIKPIGVYAPAFENGLITPSDIYTDKKMNFNGFEPRNYDWKYNGDVSVRTALRKSLNTIPVQILNELGPEISFEFLTDKLGITSLVRSEKGADGKVFSDIGLSQLALGGVTHGISVLELTAAYTPFANRGVYSKPYCYTSVVDAGGKELLSSGPDSHTALSEEAAFVTSMILKEVVTSGTGGGAQLSSGMFTAGKTGTTSDNKDRWFVGYTPHYVAAVWYGYDEPKPISAAGNPCIPVWKSVMEKINAGKSMSTPKVPGKAVYKSYCTKTGLLAGENCGEEVSSCWFMAENLPKTCKSKHNGEPDEDVTEIQIPGENTAATVDPSGVDVSGEL